MCKNMVVPLPVGATVNAKHMVESTWLQKRCKQRTRAGRSLQQDALGRLDPCSRILLRVLQERHDLLELLLDALQPCMTTRLLVLCCYFQGSHPGNYFNFEGSLDQNWKGTLFVSFL